MKKVAAEVNNVISTSYKDVLATTPRQRKFSVLIDESTDVSAVKKSCVIVRYYYEKTIKIITKLWEFCQ